MPRLEARLLLEHATHKPREWLVAHGNEPLTAGQVTEFDRLHHLRSQGWPVAYLIGQREFYGRTFKVAPGVLIPRPETEELVARCLRNAPHGATVADLGTGSGCIAVSLACERADLVVIGTEASADALALAITNARALCPQALASGRLRLLQADWFDPVAQRGISFDWIVANPPYLASQDAHLQQGDLRFEPRSALTDEADGLQALGVIIRLAPPRLRNGGVLLLEHGYDQGAPVRAMMQAAGLRSVTTHRDDQHLERLTEGKQMRAAGEASR